MLILKKITTLSFVVHNNNTKIKTTRNKCETEHTCTHLLNEL